MSITGHSLIFQGWTQGPHFKTALAHAAVLESEGMSEAAIMAELDQFLPAPPAPRIPLRTTPVGLAEALTPSNEIEEANLISVRECMLHMQRLPVVVKAAIMPDACPAGKGITVGGAISVKNAIIPAAHSADICCSMYATFFAAPELQVSNAMDVLTASTRFGPGGHTPEHRVSHAILDEDVWSNPFLSGLQEFGAKHLADQGDGNHFAYLGKLHVTTDLAQELVAYDITLPLGDIYVLVTHHGSRGLGAQVYKRGTKVAAAQTEAIAEGVPASGHWIDSTSPEGVDYWDALQYLARWTKVNHQLIHNQFISNLRAHHSVTVRGQCGNEHNFVWKRPTNDPDVHLYYHGKGATPAWSDNGLPLLGLIPLNMSAPILLVSGADNPQYLSFAPHGAGRNESRTSLMKKFHTEDGKEDPKAIADQIAASTEGVDVRWFSGTPDLSETPVAYKNAEQVAQQIEDFGLATPIGHIRPLGCIMAGHIEAPWMKKKLRRQAEAKAAEAEAESTEAE
jgi:tRNA-splicing ligase RtcB